MKLHINKEILKIFGGGVAITVVMSLGARHIEKKLMCHVDGNHAHKYTTITGLEKYVKSESTIYDLMLQSRDDIKYLDEEENRLIEFLDTNDLFLIDENLDLIKNKEETSKDFTEYEYIKEKVDNKGKKVEVKEWSKDISKCDGNARDCYYVYEAYKIEDDQLIKSDKVKSVLDIKDEYPYIKLNYYEIVRGDTYSIDLENNKQK